MLPRGRCANVLFAGPTLIVTILLVGLCIFAGVLMKRSARPATQAGRTCPRSGCGTLNPLAARYCGQCGHKLS
jgi:hypothetical protein